MWSVIAILLSFMAACTESRGTEQQTPKHSTQNIPDSLIKTLRQGDLVLRKGRDVASYMISRTGVKDKMYSHCGLVQIEYGVPVVYHFISGTSRVRNGLVKDAATNFFSSIENSAVCVKRYTMNEEQSKKQALLINGYYRQQKGFDMDFDLKDEGELYCSEFVYRVMNEVMQDSSFIQQANKNGFVYIPIDQLYMNGRAYDVWQMHFK